MDIVEGEFELTLKLDDGITEASIWHQDSNGNWVEIDSVIDNGNISSTITSFSAYGVFAPVADNIEEPGNSDNSSGVQETDPCESQDSIAAGCGDVDDEDKQLTTTLSDASDDGQKLPKTATNSYKMLLIGFGLLLAGGITYFIRRKRMN